MATIRICDRCGATVDPDKGRTISISPGLPSTNPRVVSVDTTITVASTADLCGLCLASATIESVLARLGRDAEALVPLAKRLASRLG